MTATASSPAPFPIKPKPYQAAALDVVLRASVETALVNGLVVLPTGCGKTIFGLMLSDVLGRTLWTAESVQLVDQPHEEAMSLWPHKQYGVVQERRNHFGAKDIVFATVDSVGQPKRLERLRETHVADPFKLVVVDEAHHAIRESIYERILTSLPNTHVIGLTATPERADGVSLQGLFRDGIMYRYPIRAAIAEGHLVPPDDGEGHARARRHILPKFDPSKVPVASNGDYDQKKLEQAMLEADAAEATAEAAEWAVRRGRRVLVFTIGVTISKMVAKLLWEKHRITAEHIDGETKAADCKRILEGHKAGEFQVLTNCAKLIEGYNDQRLDCIVMACPTKSRSRYAQILGRGLRPWPGKKNCLVIDIVGAHAAHGMQTADAVLLDEEPVDRKKRKSRDGIVLGPTDPSGMIDRLRNLLKYVSGIADVESNSPALPAVEWIPVQLPSKAIVYALEAGEKGGMVLIEPVSLERWNVIVEPPRFVDTPMLISYEPVSFDLAQAIGENYAREHGELRVMAKDTFWKRKPVSHGQLGKLASLNVRLTPEDEKDLTMGGASRLITQAKAALRAKSRATRQPEKRVRFYTDI